MMRVIQPRKTDRVGEKTDKSQSNDLTKVRTRNQYLRKVWLQRGTEQFFLLQQGRQYIGTNMD